MRSERRPTQASDDARAAAAVAGACTMRHDRHYRSPQAAVMPNRRQFLAAGSACIAAVTAGAVRGQPPRADAGAATHEGDADLELVVQPGRVYRRASDQDRLRQDAWLFTLVLRSAQAYKPVIEEFVVTALSQGQVRRVTTWPAQVAAALDLVPAVATDATGERRPVAAFQVAEILPRALAIDAARCQLDCRTPAGPRRFELVVPIETYVQKTRLLFPFAGRGMITQGGAWNDGHRNRSGMFAVDAIGLTERYAAMVGEGDEPEAVAGWGREILAPAAGEVVVARADRPDQPVTGVSDPAYFAPEFPHGGDPGNHLVIDHGNGEFSLLAHLQHDSLKVGVGDRVRQGQPLGRLGNSGDSSSPHVHHQLQTGAQWTQADALPHAYANGPKAQHDRGVLFNAQVDPA